MAVDDNPFWNAKFISARAWVGLITVESAKFVTITFLLNE